MRGWILAIVLAAAAAVPPPRRRSSSPACFRTTGRSACSSPLRTAADEHPLLAVAGHRLRPGVVARRRVDRLHVGARRLRRSLSREAGRHRSRAADRQSRLRRSGGVLAGRQAARVRHARARGGTANLWTLDLATQRAEAADLGRRRRLSAVVVARRPVDRVLVRPRQHDAVRARPLGAPAARRPLS